MAVDHAADFQLRRNLGDAGCNSEIIERFFRFRTAGRLREQFQLLQQHRKVLLEQLHANQKRIDSLDFLLYCLKSGESLPGRKGIPKQNRTSRKTHSGGEKNET